MASAELKIQEQLGLLLFQLCIKDAMVENLQAELAKEKEKNGKSE